MGRVHQLARQTRTDLLAMWLLTRGNSNPKGTLETGQALSNDGLIAQIIDAEEDE